jgi:HEAT repeat protein
MTSGDPIPNVALSEAELMKLAAVDRAVIIGAEGVLALVAMLTEPSWVVRRSVVRGLAAMGDAAVPALLEVLRSQRDDEARIAAAVEALAISSGNVDEEMLLLARHADPAVVCDAVQVMGRRRSGAAVPLLRELVAGADDNAAVSSIEALGRIGGTAAVESLVDAVKSESFFRVFPAIDVLGRSGDPRAVPPLASLLGDPLYAFEAARALARTAQSAAVAPLASLLVQRGDAQTRTAAVALAELHERAEERHGSAASIVRALQALPNGDIVARRMSHSLEGAENDEKIAACVVLGSLGGQEPVAILTELVESPPPVGDAAERALARLASNVQNELARVLRDGNSARRLAVLPLLTRPLDNAVVDECLADPDPAVRAAACAAVARFNDPTRVGPLFARLGDTDGIVVQAAISAIQSLGGAETERQALSLLRSSTGSVRRSALRILSYFGYPSAFDDMLAAVSDADQRVRDAALSGLSIMETDRATDVLIGASRDTSPRTRAAAMKALGHRVVQNEVVTALVVGITDREPWVRYYACQALGKLGVREVIAKVSSLLEDPAGQVRVAALEALSQLRSTEARGALFAAARSSDEDLRRAALVGLGMTGDEEALTVILGAVRAEDSMTRLIAVSALSSFESALVLPALTEAAKDPDESVRTAALGCLAARPGEETTAALVRMLADSEAPERILLALATPAEGRIVGLARHLRSAGEELARSLVSVLGRMGTTEATAALLEAMQSGTPVVRRAVATTLGALSSKEAMETLRRAANEDADPDVRRIAAVLARS